MKKTKQNKLYLKILEEIKKKDETMFKNSLNLHHNTLYLFKNGRQKKFSDFSLYKICKYLQIKFYEAERLNVFE